MLTRPSSGQAFYLTFFLTSYPPVTETLTAQFQISGYSLQMGPAEGEGQRKAGCEIHLPLICVLFHIYPSLIVNFLKAETLLVSKLCIQVVVVV